MAEPDKKTPKRRFASDNPFAAPRVIQSTLFGILFAAAIFLTVIGSLQALSSDPETSRQAYPVLLANLVLIVTLGIYLIIRVWNVLFAKKIRRSAPLLHRRFVLIFSLAALLPAVLVGGFSSSLISKNINELFGENVRTTLSDADEFLNNYLTQELADLLPQVIAAKTYLEDNRRLFDDRISFTAYLQRFARGRDVDSIYLLNKEGEVFTRVISPRSPELKIPAPEIFDHIENVGIPGVQTRDDIDYLVGFSKLDGYDDTFLIVGRYLQSNVGILSSLSGIDEAEQALDRYNADQGVFRKIFFLTFLDTALLIFLAAIWLGLILANRIIEPLGTLVDAAEKVRQGDLNARVAVKGEWGEISDLGSAFNRMTRQLSSQREDLVREHDISERQRQFSEAVLSGVRAGVIGLTEEGRIRLMNHSAEVLLATSSNALIDQPIEKALPEFAHAFKSVRENVLGRYEDQIDFITEQGLKHFDIRVSGYADGSGHTGWVITFDDMTRLVAAQRQSAWREVARRIAHEIKNPLTPILLSTERLRRKYKKEIKSDPDIFDSCTDTIIRQVGSLENMVDEFSTFARMPTLDFQPHKIDDILDPVLFAQGVAFPDVRFETHGGTEELGAIRCDERLLSQALTNIYKNAAESVSERVDRSGVDVPDGLITTHLERDDEFLKIRIEDNGQGWPFPDVERVLEPYVTTRDSGTGLGLAIVNRIIEDHGGHVTLAGRDDNEDGAQVSILLPFQDTKSGQSNEQSIQLEGKVLNET